MAGVDLELRACEVLGLAGLLGSGRSETARLLAGVDRPSASSMTLDGQPFWPPTRPPCRLHLDFRPDDQAAEVARLVAHGTQHVDIGQGDQPWVVLADPEGNEFCVLGQRRGKWP